MTTAIKQQDGTTVLDPNAPLPEAFKHLVANPDRDAAGIYETARQEQVCQLWVMYNCFSTTAASVDGNGPLDASSSDDVEHPRTDSGRNGQGAYRRCPRCLTLCWVSPGHGLTPTETSRNDQWTAVERGSAM